MYDIISDVFSAVEWLFNKIILPALEAIEKAYRWITGQDEKPVQEYKSQKPEPSANREMVNAVNQTGGSKLAQPTVGASGEGKGKAESVATGGKRSTVININLKSLVEQIVFEGGVKENRNDIVNEMSGYILQALNMAQASVS